MSRQDWRLTTRQFQSNAANNGGSISITMLNNIDIYVVRALESAGLNFQLPELCLCVGDNVPASLTKLYYSVTGNPLLASNNLSASSYSLYTGWVGDGISTYINTGFSPSAQPIGMGFYLRTSINSTSVLVPMGCRNSASTVVQRFNTTSPAGTIGGSLGGSGVGASVSASVGSSITSGYYSMERTSTTNLQLYQNGISISSQTGSVTTFSTGVPVYIFAQNANNAPGAYVPAGTQIAGFHISNGMSASDSLKFYQIMQIFHKVIGRAV